jgi:hypothetical protein
VNEAKSQYQESLRNLEKISNEIHAQRNQGKLRRELGERTAGVGEEQITHTQFVCSVQPNQPFFFKLFHSRINFPPLEVQQSPLPND